MSSNIVILILIVAAAVAFFMWMKRGKNDGSGAPNFDTKIDSMPVLTSPGQWNQELSRCAGELL